MSEFNSAEKRGGETRGHRPSRRDTGVRRIDSRDGGRDRGTKVETGAEGEEVDDTISVRRQSHNSNTETGEQGGEEIHTLPYSFTQPPPPFLVRRSQFPTPSTSCNPSCKDPASENPPPCFFPHHAFPTPCFSHAIPMQRPRYLRIRIPAGLKKPALYVFSEEDRTAGAGVRLLKNRATYSM